MKFRVLFLILGLVGFVISGYGQSFTPKAIGANGFLDRPWAMVFAPDSFLWVTERERGRVIRVNPETSQLESLVQIPDVISTAGQEGLLGMAIHPDLLGEQPYVYVSYTYMAADKRQKIVRYTYQQMDEQRVLVDPITILENLPANNDHNSGRLILGPDEKLYYTIGDQGGNQNRNFCLPVLSQFLPTQNEIDSADWSHYPGKVLRLNIDGTIPDDNPELNGVRSHIFTYGHRNPQGLIFSQNGILYSDEHGPDTDDEVNILQAGMNYGWPRVVGFQDDQAYDYCNWSSLDNCASLSYDKFTCPEGATFLEESTFDEPNYQEPLASMFAVTDDYNFDDPACGNSWICRPNVAPSSIAIYESDAIPGWKNSILVTSLKRGRVFRFQLDESGTSVVGDTTHHFYSQNRYRDIAIHPDGKTIYILTDQTGRTSDASGLNVAPRLNNPGNILQFTLNESTSSRVTSLPSPFQIFPNPAHDKIQIRWTQTEFSIDQAQLLNTQGQVMQNVYNLMAGSHTLSVAGLTPGVYWLRLLANDKNWNHRVVVSSTEY